MWAKEHGHYLFDMAVDPAPDNAPLVIEVHEVLSAHGAIPLDNTVDRLRDVLEGRKPRRFEGNEHARLLLGRGRQSEE